MLRKFLGSAIFSATVEVLSKVVHVAWSGAMVTELQTKMEKYENRAADYEEQARQMADGPQRAFCEVLAGYYSGLATDFRKIIEKRKTAQPV
jgi:hypothetical protein